MPRVSYPNQRTVRVHRERASSDFLGIKNENWKYALKDLQPYAFSLYLYFAANADNYTFSLSPEAVNQDIGMARSTYRDQFVRLVNKGYLVQTGSNTFDFFEVPQTRGAQLQKTVSATNFEKTGNTQEQDPANNLIDSSSIEINNILTNNDINNGENNQQEAAIDIPKVKEVVIQRPQRETKEKEFIF